MKVAFLDRDGVINVEVNYLHKVIDFEYTYKCTSALKIIQKLGYKIIIVTNQAGIAKGIFSKNDYEALTAWLMADLLAEGISVLDCFHCPHHPNGILPAYSFQCGCRKPAPGMILQAKHQYDIDMSNSFLVGDKDSDIEAARRANLGGYYQVESGHPLNRSAFKYNIIKRDLYDVAIHLADLSDQKII